MRDKGSTRRRVGWMGLLAGMSLLTAQAAGAVTGVLENPSAGSTQTGIDLISGWVCEADQVTVTVDGETTLEAAYGTSREDTRSVCGDADNGFGLLFNYNLFEEGPHTVRVLADGTEFAHAEFAVVTLGEEFLRGLEHTLTVPDFPRPGSHITLGWRQSSQDFAIQAAQSGVPPLEGTYELERATVHFGDGSVFDTESEGDSASGTMVIEDDRVTQRITVEGNSGGGNVSAELSNTFVDQGHLLQVSNRTDTTRNVVLVRRGNPLITESHIRRLGTDFAEVDQWVKTSGTPQNLDAAGQFSSESRGSRSVPIMPSSSVGRVVADLIQGVGP